MDAQQWVLVSCSSQLINADHPKFGQGPAAPWSGKYPLTLTGYKSSQLLLWAQRRVGEEGISAGTRLAGWQGYLVVMLNGACLIKKVAGDMK